MNKYYTTLLVRDHFRIVDNQTRPRTAAFAMIINKTARQTTAFRRIDDRNEIEDVRDDDRSPHEYLSE